MVKETTVLLTVRAWRNVHNHNTISYKNNAHNLAGDRNVFHNDYQKHLNQHNMNYNDLSRIGQSVHRSSLEHAQTNNYDSRHGHWDHNNYRDNYRDREDRHIHKPYKKQDYQENKQNPSPNRRRNNYGDRRNFHDKNNRRNNRNYY
ncbi:hypothetical protein NQ315_013201 [Exocentrus adspersus]|uniref:Uncharacterized protein n=1 Tax=Exocentrus adspersus TaxID=1586481 RepID=A0AAV8V4P6_9CUCU|nr:hypothetical protein NQ315_013201 [Exocentrus adspersus]